MRKILAKVLVSVGLVLPVVAIAAPVATPVSAVAAAHPHIYGD